MKKLRIILLCAIALGMFYPLTVSSQKAAEKITTTISLSTRSNTYEFETSGIEVSNPAGNYLKSVKIRLDKTHPLMQNFGIYPNKYFEINWLMTDVGNDGEYNPDDGDVMVTDAIAILNKSGNLSISFHINGAGTYLPLGW